MQTSSPWFSGRLDRIGIAVSALCAVHCVASLLLVTGLGLGSTFFFSHEVHEIGLLAATLIAAVAIGAGAIMHQRRKPFVVAMMGLSFMGGALAVGHGVEETVLTIIGVSLVAAGHILNLRSA